MAKVFKAVQIMIGVSVSTLLMIPVLQKSPAQAPGETVPQDQGVPQVIVIPTTGYKPGRSLRKPNGAENYSKI